MQRTRLISKDRKGRDVINTFLFHAMNSSADQLYCFMGRFPRLCYIWPARCFLKNQFKCVGPAFCITHLTSKENTWSVHFSVVLRNVLIVFKTTRGSVELEQHARPNKYICFIFMSSLLFIGKRQNCMLSIYLMN